MRRALLWCIYWPLELATLSLWNLSFHVLSLSNWFGKWALHYYKLLEPVAVEWRFQQLLRFTNDMIELERQKEP